jgi:lipopolysaccharide export system protein LptA
MKPILPILCLALLCAAAPAHAQTAAASGDKTTTVTSDVFRLDLEKHEGTFTGNVRVQDPKFDLTSDEMVIYFDKDNKFQRMVAKGNVVIKQSDKTSTSRQAEYIVAEKKIVLTGDPVVTQNQNKLTGASIVIYQDTGRMEVEGRTKFQFTPE